jgi:hypothetical protein
MPYKQTPPPLAHPVDKNAMRRVIAALDAALNSISAIHTDNATARMEIDRASTILHIRIRTVERAMRRGTNGGGR